MKREKYENIGIPTFFVALSEKDNITTDLLTRIIHNKVFKLSSNIMVLNKQDFFNILKDYKPLVIKPFDTYRVA